MNILSNPDAFQKLTLMGDVTLYEPAGDAPQSESNKRQAYQSRSLAECITNVSTPKGSKPLLKTMVTTAARIAPAFSAASAASAGVGSSSGDGPPGQW